MAEWYYMYNGQQNGPVSGTQLKSLAATGGLGPNDLVWNEAMKDWVAAQRVRGLNFAQAVAAAVPRQPVAAPICAPAPTYTVPPAEAPQDQAYAPLPQASFAGYEAPAEQAPPQSLGYARPSDEPVSGPTIEYLRQTRPWVMLISIIMFIGVALMGVVGLFGLLGMLVGGAVAGSRVPGPGASAGPSALAGGIMAGFGAFFMILILGEAALFFFPALFLMKYASAIRRLTASRQSRDLEAAMKAQKSYWMFIGIVMLVILSIYAIVILLAIAGALH